MSHDIPLPFSLLPPIVKHVVIIKCTRILYKIIILSDSVCRNRYSQFIYAVTARPESKFRHLIVSDQIIITVSDSKIHIVKAGNIVFVGIYKIAFTVILPFAFRLTFEMK